MRGMGCRTVKGFPGSAALREAITRTRSSEEMAELLRRFAEEADRLPTHGSEPGAGADGGWAAREHPASGSLAAQAAPAG
jgi:hypothetical protein